MRTAWIPGCADGNGSNIPGRYITPWREDEDVLDADLQGDDHPETYPYDPMSFQAFVASTWRVRTYDFEWSVAFASQASGFTFIRAGTASAVCTCLFPPTGVAAELGTNEEWRVGAGYRHQFIETLADIPGFEHATFTVTAIVGGRHQYILPGDGVPQRFRPEVFFVAALALGEISPGVQEEASWGILSSSLAGPSAGSSSFGLNYYDFDTGQMEAYLSSGQMVFASSGATVIIGPATFSANLRIRAVDYWEHRDASGNNPIWDQASGALLRNPFVGASTSISGSPVINPAALSGVRFVG